MSKSTCQQCGGPLTGYYQFSVCSDCYSSNSREAQKERLKKEGSAKLVVLATPEGFGALWPNGDRSRGDLSADEDMPHTMYEVTETGKRILDELIKNLEGKVPCPHCGVDTRFYGCFCEKPNATD